MKQFKLMLTTFDRISIPNILPQLGKYEVGIVIRDLTSKLGLSQTEIVQMGLKQEPGRAAGESVITWRAERDRAREFVLTELEFNLVKKSLAEMNEKEKLPVGAQWLTLYEKFQDAKPDEKKPQKEKS